MTSSKILFYLCLSFVLGIFFESIIKIPQFILWLFLFFAIVFISIPFLIRKNLLLSNSNFPLIGFYILFLVLGILRMQISEFSIENNDLLKLNGTEEAIELTGVIIREPDVRDSSQKIKVSQLSISNSRLITSGTVLVTTSRYPEYHYLDKLKILGKLKDPVEIESFFPEAQSGQGESYRNYLLKDGIYSLIYFPKIEVIKKDELSFYNNSVSFIYKNILDFKEKMRESIRRNFLPPQSSVFEGIILGDQNALGEEMKAKFRATGLSHIIAVSGAHIVILASIIMSFLIFLGLWRNQAFYATVIFIFVYVILVGLPASGVRAAIMGTIYLTGQSLGRQATGSRVIVLAATFMLVFNPLLLFFDIGFQLSFMAVLSLIYLEPIIRGSIKSIVNKFLKFKIKEKYDNVLMIFSATVAAQVFTFPIIIYNFGNISFVSLLTNILVLPIVYYLMLFGFLSSLLGIIFQFGGWILSLPCYFLMEYFLWVVNLFSGPWAYKVVSIPWFLGGTKLSWIWLFISYILLGFLTKYFYKKMKTKFLDY